MRKNILIPLLVLFALSGFARPAVHTRAGAYSITIVNKTRSEIREVRLAWSGTGRWGPDVLGKQVLRPDESYVIGGVSAGGYDIRFVNADGACVCGPIPVYDNLTSELTERRCRPSN